MFSICVTQLHSTSGTTFMVVSLCVFVCVFMCSVHYTGTTRFFLDLLIV